MVFYSGVNSYSGDEVVKCVHKAKVKYSQNFHLKYCTSPLKSGTCELHTQVQPRQEFFSIEHTALHWLFNRH